MHARGARAGRSPPRLWMVRRRTPCEMIPGRMRHRAVLVSFLALTLSVSCAGPLSAVRGALPTKSGPATGARSSPAADAEILKAPCQIEQDGVAALAAASSFHVQADLTWTQGRSRHADEWYSVPNRKVAGMQVLDGRHVDIVSVN